MLATCHFHAYERRWSGLAKMIKNFRRNDRRSQRQLATMSTYTRRPKPAGNGGAPGSAQLFTATCYPRGREPAILAPPTKDRGESSSQNADHIRAPRQFVAHATGSLSHELPSRIETLT
jgi:hypothetical protein